MSAGLVEERRGCQFPSFSWVPTCADGALDAGDATELAGSYGLEADPWQADVLTGWMGRRADGKWAASRCGLAVPRQNGKNGVLEVRELFGMVELGEKFLHTAHEVKTARKAFARLLSFFDNPREFPELAALVREVRRANGQEAIYLVNGGSVEFIARSKGSGRGFTVDVLVCDEAQELSDDALAALLPTISAAPSGNPQLILTGTPPAPSMNGEVFFRMRELARKGNDNRLSWKEWSSPELDEWKANPSLGGRLGFEVIEDERATMDPVTFARERCGVWDESWNSSLMDLSMWPSLSDARAAMSAPAAFAIAVSPDREWASIGVAGPSVADPERLHLELTSKDGRVDRRRGVEWLVDRCAELRSTYKRVPWVVDDHGPAASLIPELKKKRLTIVATKPAQLADATEMFVDGLRARRYVHGPQQEVDDAIASVKPRPMGDRVVMGRKASEVDITAIEVLMLAAYGATNYKRPTYVVDIQALMMGAARAEEDVADPENP